MKQRSWREGVTGYQWLVLFVAWLGWVFDSMDSTIYAIVLHPALQELLGPTAGSAAESDIIGWYGGIIFSIFLIGWAAGGVLFGVLADRFGRTKTLIFTILIYAVFTGMAALSATWWQLAIYRFLTALGIGGEWAAGAALVAEVWPEDKRAKAAGILQSAWAAGFLFAALVNLAMSGFGWRFLFLIGIAPAIVAMFVRLWVKEPERWVKARANEQLAGDGSSGKLAELFSPALRRSTLVGSGLAFVAVFGLWGATNWTPTLIRALPSLKGVDGSTISDYVSYATMALNVGALVRHGSGRRAPDSASTSAAFWHRQGPS
ncbi:MAG: Major facilitator superfamily transporter [Acidobacteria bacterium]|nr:Major facilitator superfamily transporter [Acidobacteriota bacterium]